MAPRLLSLGYQTDRPPGRRCWRQPEQKPRDPQSFRRLRSPRERFAFQAHQPPQGRLT